MRTFEEIGDDVRSAKDRNNAEALFGYAKELDAFGTPEAEVIACDARGWASYLTSDYTQALEYYVHALKLFEKLGDRKGVASAHGNIGSAYCSMGNYAKALEYQHRSFALYEEIGDRKGMAANLGNIGIAHRDTGDYPAALEYYHRALALHEARGDRNGVANIVGNIGNLYRVTGDYPASLECLHRALSMNEEVGDRLGVALVTGNIGIIHDITGDYPAALDHYQRALALHEELGNRSGVGRVTGNLGSAYLSTGQHQQGLEYLQRALALHQEVEDVESVAGAIGGLVHAYLDLGSDAEAQTLLETTHTMKIDDPGLRIFLDHGRARLMERSGELDGAIKILLRSLSEANAHGLRAEAARTHQALRELALKQNDLAGYVEHNSEYTRITEEINGKETATKLAMQARQREIDAREREHAKQLAVLHSTLPKHIADRVARGETVNDHFDSAAVIFLDIVGFTTISDRIPSGHVVYLLEQIFTTLDRVCAKHGVVKIKTIGDSYMAVSFANTEHQTPKTNSHVPYTEHVVNAGLCAVEMLSALNALEITMPPELGDTAWTKEVGDIQVRIGMHCGPVTAGVIGTERMQYDVWGDTVNVASRMESSGEPGRIHVSEQFAHSMTQCLPDSMTLLKRGTIEVKGKGPMTTYWLKGTT